VGSRVTVILINHNGAAIEDVITHSVQAIWQQTYPDWELILADDGSTDGSDRLLNSFARGDRVRFTRTADARGVGAARNAAIRLAEGEYLAFLDNDAVPEPDWLARLVDLMERDPQIGACASCVVFYERPDVINSLGSVLNPQAHGTGVHMHELVGYCRPEGDVMYATGNGMAIRHKVLREIGLFDEGYRFYGHDDSDIGIRIRDAGYTIVQQPDAVVRHLHSTSKRDPTMFFWDQRNRIRFALKHYHWRELAWFVRYDVLPYLNRHQLPNYVKAWLSAAGNTGALLRHRWLNRRRPPFFPRFRCYFEGDRRYVKMPDNRAFARQPVVLDALQVGENEGDYFYSGWYPRERWQDRWVCWANPIASLRVVLAQSLTGLHLRVALHPAVSAAQVTLAAHEWDGGALVGKTQFDVSAGSCWTERSLPLELPAGEYRLILQVSDHHLEDGFTPRRIGLGLNKLRVR
jgi:GT2 family glycosyltransferase